MCRHIVVDQVWGREESLIASDNPYFSTTQKPLLPSPFFYDWLSPDAKLALV
jgi:hypothetical protein